MVKATADARDTSRDAEPAHDEVMALTTRHRELERQIATLDRHLALSTAEQLERTRLKKEKLRVKDRLQALQARLTLQES